MLQKATFQLTLFFYALSYFTRIPIPKAVIFDNEQFHKANAYLPLIGTLMALVMVSFFYLCQLLFSIPVSIILMLVLSLLMTGALHEDGFADCCDGLGGGYSIEQRLNIMKDSQIGSYGGIGLIMLLLLKFTLLVELASQSLTVLAISVVLGQTVSRYVALYIMQSLPYVRLENGGKVQGLAKKLNRKYFLFASISTLVTLLLLPLSSALLLLTVTALMTVILKKLFMKNIAGYTGDCLGFAQQSLELGILLILSVSLSL